MLSTGFCINLHNNQPIPTTLSVATVTFQLITQSTTADAVVSQAVSLLQQTAVAGATGGRRWGEVSAETAQKRRFERCQLRAKLKERASQGVARWWESDYHTVGMLPTGVT
jgi:hypothetical protein